MPGAAAPSAQESAASSSREGAAAGLIQDRPYLAPIEHEGDGLTADEVEKALLKAHQEDPSGKMMVGIGGLSCLILLICAFGSSWVTGTFEDAAGSSAHFQISLWSFTAHFICSKEEPSHDNLFCGTASKLLQGSRSLGDAVQASRDVSADAYKSILMYERSRYVIFASFAWVAKIMVTAALPMYWYIFNEPLRKHRIRALSLFSMAPLAGLVGLTVWSFLNPGIEMLALHLAGSKGVYYAREPLTWGWAPCTAAASLVTFKVLAVHFSIRLKPDPREKKLEKELYEKQVDERVAAQQNAATGASYGSTV